MKTVEFNGVTFEVVKAGTKRNRQLRDRALWNYGDVWDVYGNCSYAKKEVWLEWEKFFMELNKHGTPCTEPTVCSYNTFSFSISAGTREALFLITPKHNYYILRA